MNARDLIARGVAGYWRTHVGVLLGVTAAAAILVGALAVGDSVSHSLRRVALDRIGAVDDALVAQERFFLADLGDRLEGECPDLRTAAAIAVRGVAVTADGSRRVLDVQVTGVDGDFYELGATPLEPSLRPERREVVLNQRLAAQLGVAAGDELLLRVESPSAMPRDMVLSTSEDVALALRVTVKTVAGAGTLANFGLAASQGAAPGALVDRGWLARELELGERANLLLADRGPECSAQALDDALERCWSLADAELEVEERDAVVELTSARIFLDTPVSAAVASGTIPGLGVLTYFVNELRAGERETPYSMVSAVQALGGTAAPGGEGFDLATAGGALAADEIAIGEWLAEDLAVGPATRCRCATSCSGPAARWSRRNPACA